MNRDVVIIGAGAMGLSLALELRRHGMSVAVLERGEPGREASYAAAGMIAHLDPKLPPELAALARQSAALYPAFVQQLEAESNLRIDFRRAGAIELAYQELDSALVDGKEVHALTPEELAALEPEVQFHSHSYLAREDCLDPRQLAAALAAAARSLGAEILTGTPVVEVTVEHGHTTGVRTAGEQHSAAVVVNCAGAWAPQIAPGNIPTVPARGHMLSVIAPNAAQSGPLLSHVVRGPDCYIVPRSDGRLVIGSTLEPAGFDKTVNPGRIQRLRQAAEKIVPAVACMQLQEAWTGLRPGTPDGLPILGETHIRGYFACTGHYRDGILLTPVTARVMADLIRTGRTDADLSQFSPLRFL